METEARCKLADIHRQVQIDLDLLRCSQLRDQPQRRIRLLLVYSVSHTIMPMRPTLQ